MSTAVSTVDYVIDPLKLAADLWPDTYFYKEQRDIINAVWYEADETYVSAGNMLGKDFVAGFLCLAFFLTRHPCRIVTTSAKDDHLRVLWGEINRFLDNCRVPLSFKKGGPLIVNHHDIRKVVALQKCPISYLIGMVAGPDSIAAMQGHHVARVGRQAPLMCCGKKEYNPLDRTLFVCDEASSVSDDYMKMTRTWANRVLVIGNTWPCENFFKHAIEGKPGTDDLGGDRPRTGRQGYYRRVIHIEATASPNVRLGISQYEKGMTPTDEVLVPGLKTYGEYCKNLEMWDEAQQCVSLRAQFYKGKDVLLYPAEWLKRAKEIAERLRGKVRKARGIGVDPAEGGDKTAMVAVDEYGVIEVSSKTTPDTAMIPLEAYGFAVKHGLKDNPELICFDRGGGGKQHVDRLKADYDFACRSIGFGEAIVPDPKRGITVLEERVDQRGEQYAYKNRRAQMYGDLRDLLDPSLNPQGFGIPKEEYELLRQLGPIPLWYDREGRMYLPPKQRNANAKGPVAQEVTLNSLLGCSPDEADALALAVHAMLREEPKAFATGF